MDEPRGLVSSGDGRAGLDIEASLRVECCLW